MWNKSQWPSGSPYSSNWTHTSATYLAAYDPGCVGDEVWDDATQSCLAPVTGVGETFSFEYSGALPPQSVCENGYWHELQSDDVIISSGIGTHLANYTKTANVCTVATGGTPTTSDACITGASGQQICLDTSATNCGYYNDVYGCAESIPADGECTLLGAGGFICNNGTPPNNTDGTPQTPIGDISGDLDQNGTLETATIYTQGAIGTKIPEELKIEIDETGTPTGTDTMFDDVDGGIGDFLSDIGSESEGGGVATSSMLSGLLPDFGLPGSGSCNTSTFTFSGYSFDFPGATGCTWLENFKTVIGWVLYLYTVMALYDLITIGSRAKN